MSKLAKVCLITAAIMISLGLFIGTIVTAVGGGNLIRNVTREGISIGPWGLNVWDWNWNWGWNNSWNDSWGWNSGYRGDGIRDLTVNGTKISNKSYDSKFAAEGINKLDLSFGVGDFNIIPWEKNEFEIKINGIGGCKYYTRGNTLYVEGFHMNGQRNEGVSVRNNVLKLYVPKDVYYDEIKIQLGVGNVDIKGLSAARLTSDSGVGTLDMSNMVLNRLDVSNSIGETGFRGEVNGDINVENGIGSTNLMIRGDEDDFNYEITCSIGSVSVGRRSFSGLAGVRSVNNNSDKSMKLNCAIGSIEVGFY